MAISRKEIEHIASLARLDSTGGIFDRLADDIGDIAQIKLSQLVHHCDDTLHVIGQTVEVIQEFTPDELIEPNAPDFQCGGVAVPRVVE